MDKFQGILMCTDLDGTLLSDAHTVSRENLEAIEYFKSEGGKFTFITGRMHFFATDFYKEVGANAPFGCINGGGIYDCDNSRYVWKNPIDRSVLELVEYVDKRVEGMGIQINTFERIHFSRDNEAQERFRRITGAPKITTPYWEVEEEIAKILFVDFDGEKLAKVKELLDSHPRTCEFDYIRSEETLYEILPKGVSKGNVLMKLAEHLGIDRGRTVALGDYNNDVSMLRAAGVGIAVANAVPEAKAAADRITVSNNEHAIAKTVEEIEKGIIEFKLQKA